MQRIENQILLSFQKRELKRYNEMLQATAMEKTEQVVELQNSIMNTIAELVESRDDIISGHIIRTQRYLQILLDRLISKKIYEDDIKSWNLAFLIPSSQLHDVGKIKISEAILNKPGKFTPDEFTFVKNHAQWGAKIIEQIEKKTKGHVFLYHAKIFAASHHEKWDGSGYPQGLAGEAIPLQGRLMAIADVYDALISKLPYKEAFTPDEAKKIILADKGIHFDPLLVDIFESVADEFSDIAKAAY
jgi:putative two-component system response regulator